MRKSKDKKIEIREIVYSQDDEKSFGDIFVYEPENVEERNLGSLFIVGELKDLPRNSSYVVNLLASKIKKEFYSNTKRNAEDSLEAALSVANQTLSELAQQGNGEYVGKLSMVCGTYRNNEFFLSQVGRIKSLLVRGGQIVEIIKEEDGKPASVKRAFNNIASGELADGDLIIFATPGLFNIFSFDKLRQLASSLELDEFATRLQEEIEEDDSEVVSALLVEINGGKKEQPMERVAVNLEDEPEEEDYLEKTMEGVSEENEEGDETEEGVSTELEDKEEEAVEETAVPEKKKSAKAAKKIEESVLSEELTETKGNVSEGKAAASESAEKDKDNVNGDELEIDSKEADKISLSDIIKEYEKMENRSVETVGASEKDKNIENIIAKKDSTDFQDLDDQPRQGFAQEILTKLKGSFSSVRLEGAKSSVSKKLGKLSSGEKEYRIKSAGGKQGFLLTRKNSIIAVIIVIVIATALYPKIFKEDRTQEDRKATYQALLSDSQNAISEAEAAIASGSNQEGGKLLFDAKALAMRVRDEYDGLDSEAGAVINKAQEELNKIDKIITVEDIQTVASFDNGNISNFVEIAGNIYAVDGKENTVYKVDTAASKLTQLAKTGSKIGEIKFAQSFQNQEILLSDGSVVSSFGLKSASIEKLSGALDSSVKDIVVYGKNIYVLSPSASQIYKYQRTAQGIDGKSDWLKSGDVKDAVSMAIDQNIFVLYSDGQVKKFFTGQEVVDNGGKFNIKQPTDAITSATKIFTLNNHKNLYILEANKKRILIFDKTTGDLVKQLTGEKFSDIRDISVDAKEATLTVLMKDRISKISL